MQFENEMASQRCSITEQSTTSYVLTALEHSHVLYFPNMENAVHCSLIMHGFHNGKWLILCSKNRIYDWLICIQLSKFKSVRTDNPN